MHHGNGWGTSIKWDEYVLFKIPCNSHFAIFICFANDKYHLLNWCWCWCCCMPHTTIELSDFGVLVSIVVCFAWISVVCRTGEWASKTVPVPPKCSCLTHIQPHASTFPSSLSSLYMHIKINIYDMQRDIKPFPHFISNKNQTKRNMAWQCVLFRFCRNFGGAPEHQFTRLYWILSENMNIAKKNNIHIKSSRIDIFRFPSFFYLFPFVGCFLFFGVDLYFHGVSSLPYLNT